MPGLVASLGSWGVRAGHWLPDRDGAPAIWLTTQTEAQRNALGGRVVVGGAGGDPVDAS